MIHEFSKAVKAKWCLSIFVLSYKVPLKTKATHLLNSSWLGYHKTIHSCQRRCTDPIVRSTKLIIPQTIAITNVLFAQHAYQRSRRPHHSRDGEQNSTFVPLTKCSLRENDFWFQLDHKPVCEQSAQVAALIGALQPVAWASLGGERRRRKNSISIHSPLALFKKDNFFTLDPETLLEKDHVEDFEQMMIEYGREHRGYHEQQEQQEQQEKVSIENTKSIKGLFFFFFFTHPDSRPENAGIQVTSSGTEEQGYACRNLNKVKSISVESDGGYVVARSGEKPAEK